jgi:MFS-type transporter involved in bile tolerance (Atg22 family)
MFFLFLPTGPITSELLEIVPIHLRATGVALCTFVMHLFGDWGSPTIVGYLSDWTGSLQKGVLILPVVLMMGAVLWALLLYFSRHENNRPSPLR